MDCMAAESWRAVPGYFGLYEVSDLGRVRSKPRPRTRGGVLVQSPAVAGGYPMVTLCQSGKQRSFAVHWLVLRAFRGPARGRQTRHLDGDPTNNGLDNLAWGTQAQNEADKMRHGRYYRRNRVLKPDDVLAIREKLEAGVTGRELAGRYGVGEMTISKIKRRVTWAWLD